MKILPYFDVDYCCYGRPFRKRTRIWTSVAGFKPRLCGGVGRCKQMVGKRHIKNTSSGSDRGIKGKGTSKLERYRIPAPLVVELLGPAENPLNITAILNSTLCYNTMSHHI